MTTFSVMYTLNHPMNIAIKQLRNPCKSIMYCTRLLYFQNYLSSQSVIFVNCDRTCIDHFRISLNQFYYTNLLGPNFDFRTHHNNLHNSNLVHCNRSIQFLRFSLTGRLWQLKCSLNIKVIKMITADFKPNKLLATNKSNAQHNEVKTRLVTAQKSKSLHLSNMNLDCVLNEVFKLTNLVRLDLSYNNIVRLDPRIGDLQQLQILWLNDNPLREVPLELSNCLKLRELDLKNTFIITLPREISNLTQLLILNLDGCPTKETLTNTYNQGMTSIHTDLRRK